MIKVRDVKFATYGVSDLDAQQAFMTDFGLVPVAKTETRLYMRGTGKDAYVYVAERSPGRMGLRSVAMEAASAADFEAASRFPGAGPIEALDGPGGGQRIRFGVPGGLTVDLVEGIADAAELPHRVISPFNSGSIKRRANATQRPPAGPAQAIRLGHLALAVTDATAARDWLATHFGILVSDTTVKPDLPAPTGYFVRCDRGAEPADHHTFLLANFLPPDAPCAEAHHISFEVEDIDALEMGSQWMAKRGWRHSWGIGRHVLGSQIFDYWWDPDGNRVERYTDGDQFDASMPPNEPVEDNLEMLWMWGPNFPADFGSIRKPA